MTVDKYEHLILEQDGELLVISLDWPERKNALSLQMRTDLLQCVLAAEQDPSIYAIVITGSGDAAFSAGTNIPELLQRTLVSELGKSSELRKTLPTTLERLAKPSVAAINGYCFGGGMELALGCTARIASENARLGLPEIKFGQIPGSGGTQRLSRFVGLGWAMQMILTGDAIAASQALQIGLVTEVLPQDRLLVRAKELARTLGSRAPIAFAAARDAVLKSTETDILEGIDYEKKLYAICMATEDSREGVAAHLEKRKPEFRGR